MAEEELEEEVDEQEPYRIPLWKKLLLALAVASVLFGLGLQVFGGQGASEPGAAGNPSVAGGAGFVPETSPGGQPTGTAESGSASDWSPFFVKGGFSFFVGFCIGYALRAFFKISAVALGVVFLAIFGLQQIGLVEVDWGTAGELYDAAIEKISGELDSFRGFLTGSLPSAGLAAFGLYAGFRRTR